MAKLAVHHTSTHIIENVSGYSSVASKINHLLNKDNYIKCAKKEK